MEIPSKRSSSYNKQIKTTQKKSKTDLLLKSSESNHSPVGLRKDIWIEILNYIGTFSYFYIIPQLNSYFYSIVKNCKNYRTYLNISLNLDFEIIKSHNCLEIFDNNAKKMDYILKCQQLEKLKLNLQINKEKSADPSTYKLSLDQFLLPMISLKSLRVLKLQIDSFLSIEDGKIFALFEHLEVLKYFILSEFNDENLSILIKHMSIYQNRSTTVLRKFSLKYKSLELFDANNLFKMIGSSYLR